MFWIFALGLLCMAGLLAGGIVLIPLSLDPGEIILAGADPWTEAAEAAGAFAVAAGMTALSLRLWHSARFRAAALLLTLVQLGAVAWACRIFYTDYF